MTNPDRKSGAPLPVNDTTLDEGYLGRPRRQLRLAAHNIAAIGFRYINAFIQGMRICLNSCSASGETFESLPAFFAGKGASIAFSVCTEISQWNAACPAR